jgi:hypothetical protein
MSAVRPWFSPGSCAVYQSFIHPQKWNIAPDPYTSNRTSLSFHGESSPHPIGQLLHVSGVADSAHHQLPWGIVHVAFQLPWLAWTWNWMLLMLAATDP